MPLTRSAIKKLRQDRKKEQNNELIRSKIRVAIKTAKKTKKEDALKEAFSLVDKGIKKNLLHQNKAARIKSNLSKLIRGTATQTAVKSVSKSKVTAQKKTRSTSSKKA